MVTSRTSNTVKETQAEIIKILGFDYDIFSSTSCFEQNATDKFSTLSPSESKSLIMRLLNLEKYESYAITAKEKLRKAERELEKIETQRGYIEKFLEVPDIDEVHMLAQISAEEEGLAQIKTHLIALQKDLDIQEKIELIKNEIQELKQNPLCKYCKQDILQPSREILINERRQNITTLQLQETPRPGTDLRVAIDATKGMLKDYEENIVKDTTLLKRYKSKRGIEKTKIEELKLEEETAKQKVKSLTRIYEAFSKNGIPSMILENSIPEIEETANALLESINFNMSISIELLRENKAKEMSDTLDIIISRGKWQMSYFNYSGGERFIIDLVLRLALSIVLLRRNGCNSTTLIIDEGFGSLDSQNRYKALQLIAMIHEKFGFDKILIISHVDEVQDSIGEKIKFKKVGNTTEVLI